MSSRSGRRSSAPRGGWERRRRILLSEYERVALRLFADRGFNNVTVDDIADAAGVTTRTLHRYFGSKQDVLLAFPRRGLAAEIEMIDALEPFGDPLATACEALREFVTTSPVEVGIVDLWNAATEGAPEVVARVRGERIEAIFQALVRYGERAFGVDESRDPRPRWLAGLLAGMEFALVESIASSPSVAAGMLESMAETAARLAGSGELSSR